MIDGLVVIGRTVLLKSAQKLAARDISHSSTCTIDLNVQYVILLALSTNTAVKAIDKIRIHQHHESNVIGDGKMDILHCGGIANGAEDVCLKAEL